MAGHFLGGDVMFAFLSVIQRMYDIKCWPRSTTQLTPGTAWFIAFLQIPFHSLHLGFAFSLLPSQR